MSRADAVVAAPAEGELERLPTLGRLGDLLADARYRSVVLGSSKDPNAKVTVLLLPAQDGPVGAAALPSIAVKVPTTQVAAEAVATEAALLVALKDRSDDLVLSTVPKPLGAVETDHGLALAVEVLSGVPMATTYHRWRHTTRASAVDADFAAAATWLARFQEATAGSSRVIDDAASLSAALQARFGDDPRLGPVLAAASDGLAAIDARLSAQRAPSSAVHGDFWFGNLLTDRPGGPVRGVVDWECGQLEGSPLRDLARFAVSYALYLDRHTRPGRLVAGHRGLRAGEWGAALLFAVESSGWFNAVFRRFLSGGLDRLGIQGVSPSELAMIGIAEVAVAADHTEFATQHLELLGHLMRSGS